MQRYNEITPVEIIKRDDRQYFRGVAIAAYDGTPKTEYELPPKNGRKRVERISRQAIDGLAQDQYDTELRIDHDKRQVLANRSGETLEVAISDQGLIFETEYNGSDPDHQRAMAKIQSKIIRGCSFMCRHHKESWHKEKDMDVCTITSLTDLEDVSMCRRPAYKGSAVILRDDEHQTNDETYDRWIKTQQFLEKVGQQTR